MFETVKIEAPERFKAGALLNRTEVMNALDISVEILKRNISRFIGKFPEPALGFFAEAPSGRSLNRYRCVETPGWISGMWTGLYWLIYELTGDHCFKKAAESQVAVFEDIVHSKPELLNDHDTGFKYSPSCVAAYRITGSTQARESALLAAEIMLKHYCPVNKFIIRVGTRAEGEPYEWYRTLVDSMMNIPLFFWAYGETGNKEFYDAAVGHYNTTLKYLIREDGSSYHHYQFDPENLKPVKGVTWQGNRDESCWARGHSWLVYGYPMAYEYTGNKELIDIHRGVSYYFLNHLPSDFVPYWDFDFSDGSLEPRDSSASATACAGLLEMSRHLPDTSSDKELFKNASGAMLKALIELCANKGDDGDGLLLHTVSSKPHNSGVDTIEPYADYFYIESLLRWLNPEWQTPCW